MQYEGSVEGAVYQDLLGSWLERTKQCQEKGVREIDPPSTEAVQPGFGKLLDVGWEREVRIHSM